MWDVLSGVAEVAWDVLSRAAKMAWDVLSGATKTAWDVFVRGGKLMRGVLSGMAKKGMGCFVPGCFVLHPSQVTLPGCNGFQAGLNMVKFSLGTATCRYCLSVA